MNKRYSTILKKTTYFLIKKYSIVIVTFFMLLRCAPGAYIKTTNTGTPIPISNNTDCGKVEIRPVGGALEYLFQVRFLDIIPEKYLDSVKIESFNKSNREMLSRSFDFNTFDKCDTCFFIANTAPNVLSIWLPKTDSCIIDYRSVLKVHGKQCFPELMTIYSQK